jgi:hypothetical protein
MRGEVDEGPVDGAVEGQCGRKKKSERERGSTSSEEIFTVWWAWQQRGGDLRGTVGIISAIGLRRVKGWDTELSL